MAILVPGCLDNLEWGGIFYFIHTHSHVSWVMCVCDTAVYTHTKSGTLLSWPIDPAGTGYLCIEGRTQWGGSRLLLRPIPPDDIRNTTSISKKLRRSVVILWVCKSCCSHGEDVSRRTLYWATSAGLPQYDRQMWIRRTRVARPFHRTCRSPLARTVYHNTAVQLLSAHYYHIVGAAEVDFTFCDKRSDQDCA